MRSLFDIRQSLNVDSEVLFIEVLSAIWRIFFHPAKFDNFKNEKISDYITVLLHSRRICLV